MISKVTINGELSIKSTFDRVGIFFATILFLSFVLSVTSVGAAEPRTKYALIVYSGMTTSDAANGFGIAAKYLKENGYNLTILSDKPFSDVVVAGSPTIANLNQQMLALQSKIGVGDQVLINMMVHGSPGSDEGDVHSWGLADGLYPVTLISAAIKAIEQRGATTAFVDSSCFSGGSLILASTKTCVVSAATAHEEGWATFDTDFWSQVKSGISLESAFLVARANHAYCSSPEISSAAGTKTAKSLIESSDFLETADSTNYADLLGPKLTDMSDAAVVNPILGLVTRSSAFFPSLSAAQEIKAFNLAYKNYAKTVISLAPTSLTGVDLKKFLVVVNVDGQAIDLLNLATNNFDAVIANSQRDLNDPTSSDSIKQSAQSKISLATAMKAKRDSLVQSDRDFAALYFNANPDMSNFRRILNIRAKVDLTSKERQVYSLLYNRLSTQTPENTACTAFKF